MRYTHKLIYVHGANGSGKTTLAHVIIACAGGIAWAEEPATGSAIVSYTPRGVALVGPYRTATGGADSVHPYALVPPTIQTLLASGYSVFVEGLMTPGVDTCISIWKRAARIGIESKFILLDVPIPVCTRNVQARRDRKGNEKPYDNAHLVKKHRSSSNWIENLKAAKLPAARMSWRQARTYCLQAFNLSAENVKWL